MSNSKLYVGNLSFKTTEDELRSAFGQFGSVTDVYVAMDKMTGRPRGFAFVTMGTADEAKQAAEKMNGVDLGGRQLTVNEARPKEERPGGGFGGGGGRGFGGGGGGRGGLRRRWWWRPWRSRSRRPSLLRRFVSNETIFEGRGSSGASSLLLWLESRVPCRESQAGPSGRFDCVQTSPFLLPSVFSLASPRLARPAHAF
jgi:cold-inducible RNA-binding protein